MAGISIANMTKKYGANTVVDDMHLEIEDGEFFTFLGPSGCGKTTTLRCIAGLETPNTGRLAIGGESVFDAKAKTAVPTERRNAGMVFQSYALWPHMSVVANVSYPLRRRGMKRLDAKNKATEALQMVSLDGMADRSVSALSGGQQQRVALARAMVAEPRIVLFDEPLSNLDAKLRADMRDQIGAITRRVGTTAVYVTHDQTEALTLSDRIAVMNAGCIQQIGTPEEIYSRPRTPFVADFVGFDNLLEGEVTQGGEVGSVAVEGLGVIRIDRLAQSTGTRVVLGVRASDLRVVADDTTAPNHFTTRVENRLYLGDYVELKIRLGETVAKVRVSATELGRRSGEPIAVGDAVTVAFPTDAIAVMTDLPTR